MQRLVLSSFLALCLALAMARDTLALTSVQLLAAPYHFNYVTWEARNLPSKWLHLLFTYVAPYRQTRETSLAQMEEYFRLKGELAGVQRDLTQAAALAAETQADLEGRQRELQRRLQKLRPYAEEALESLISDALREEGIPPQLGKAIFPPVDIAMVDLPTYLITSPRERIQREFSYLLTPDMPPSVRAELENLILQQVDLSAIVENIGGISTYPAIIHSNDLRFALIIASHEWLHNYLFFYPLGRTMFKDSDVFSLNETAANVFGDELGNRIYSRLTGKPEPPLPEPSASTAPCPEDQFCFGREMRETRLRTDELLAEGNIEEAEAYMEERRQVFLGNGYYLRRINQAYFAFYGTYADSPASVSPIYQQLLEVRYASPSLAAFIHTVQSVSSYQEFLEIHQRLTS
ncbi:MAG: hypothetical protein HY532_00505 [Chloroflexi bacterium]|nr:hypothetical protein [Chloroflexota bacterium]